jgi:hypothetical protein
MAGNFSCRLLYSVSARSSELSPTSCRDHALADSCRSPGGIPISGTGGVGTRSDAAGCSVAFRGAEDTEGRFGCQPSGFACTASSAPTARLAPLNRSSAAFSPSRECARSRSEAGFESDNVDSKDVDRNIRDSADAADELLDSADAADGLVCGGRAGPPVVGNDGARTCRFWSLTKARLPVGRAAAWLAPL